MHKYYDDFLDMQFLLIFVLKFHNLNVNCYFLNDLLKIKNQVFYSKRWCIFLNKSYQKNLARSRLISEKLENLSFLSDQNNKISKYYL